MRFFFVCYHCFTYCVFVVLGTILVTGRMRSAAKGWRQPNKSHYQRSRQLFLRCAVTLQRCDRNGYCSLRVVRAGVLAYSASFTFVLARAVSEPYCVVCTGIRMVACVAQPRRQLCTGCGAQVLAEVIVCEECSCSKHRWIRSWHR